MSSMARVVRLGPLPLLQRRAARVAELERILGESVELVEVFSVGALETALAGPAVAAVVLDAPGPGALTEAVAVAGPTPILRPLWRRHRNSRGEVDEVFDGYGVLVGDEVVPLANDDLSQ